MSVRRTLAAGAITRVEMCGCGGCYLTIGPVRVSVHLEVVEELADTISRALRALREDQVAPQGPAPPTTGVADEPGPEAAESDRGLPGRPGTN